MEMTCDHHFKHPPCLGRDANGRSVTAASGVYTKSMVFCIVGIVALMSGPKGHLNIKKFEDLSKQHNNCTDAINETHNVDDCPFWEATTESYLKGHVPQ